MSMQSTLRRAACTVAGIQFDIQELSAAGFCALSDYRAEHGEDAQGQVAVVCQHGVIGWREEPLEDILAAHPLHVLVDLNGHILELGNPEDAGKNSERDPAAGFSSELQQRSA